MKKESEILRDGVSAFLTNGINFEGEILASGLSIREKSKSVYPQEYLDARMHLMSVSKHLFDCRVDQPGKTSESISKRLQLVAVFFQGTHYMEGLISEGQYIKAVAAIKQDFEILARINAIQNNDDQYGRVPNIKNLPEEVRRFYGDINDIAHISKSDILEKLLMVKREGDITSVSPIPVINPLFAKSIYELHLFLLVSMVREQIKLFDDMYEDFEKEFEHFGRYYVAAVDLLIRVGFTVT